MASNTLFNGGKRTPKFPLFDETQALMDFILNPWEDSFFLEPVRCLSKHIVSNSYPPANIYAEKGTGRYCVELAVAGYSKDEIAITTKGNVICVKLGNSKEKEKYTYEDVESGSVITRTIKPASEKDKSPERRYFQKGIKKSICEWCWDTTDFHLDLSTAEVELNDGILKISVKQSESAKEKVLVIQ